MRCLGDVIGFDIGATVSGERQVAGKKATCALAARGPGDGDGEGEGEGDIGACRCWRQTAPPAPLPPPRRRRRHRGAAHGASLRLAAQRADTLALPWRWHGAALADTQHRQSLKMAAETCRFANSPPSSGDDSTEVRVRRRKSSVPRHLPGSGATPAKRPRRPFRPWGSTENCDLPPSPPPTSGESRLSSPPPRCELTPPSEPTPPPPPQLVLRLQTPSPPLASCLTTVPPPRFVPPSPTARRRQPSCTATSASAAPAPALQQSEPLSLVHKPQPPPQQQQQQQQRNYKNMTRERRIEANARERTRVHTISAAFDTLRRAVPSYAHAQKLSKLSVLRIASAYILTLSRIAGKDYSEDGSSPSLADCVAGVSRTIQTEGKLRRKKDGES